MASKVQVEAVRQIVIDNMKILYDFEFIDEEQYYSFIKQLMEGLSEIDKKKSRRDKEISMESLESEVRKAKDKAIAQKLLLFGSLYY
ncbi:MAG: hypothetical protein HeimAB125_10530 [Candidatus Heimdallarchaeota archaeon AB_125]|nr:MAG: hypothetical protein HeimAB125_10530 [Candidatus Heimdallarchaeota archaeon AB_125]